MSVRATSRLMQCSKRSRYGDMAFNRSFKTVRALPCDVQLGDHGAQYNMQEKFAKLKDGGGNPFIDPASCTLEADIQEAMFRALLAEQQQAARP